MEGAGPDPGCTTRSRWMRSGSARIARRVAIPALAGPVAKYGLPSYCSGSPRPRAPCSNGVILTCGSTCQRSVRRCGQGRSFPRVVNRRVKVRGGKGARRGIIGTQCIQIHQKNTHHHRPQSSTGIDSYASGISVGSCSSYPHLPLMNLSPITIHDHLVPPPPPRRYSARTSHLLAHQNQPGTPIPPSRSEPQSS